jgi:hypothetical protein
VGGQGISCWPPSISNVAPVTAVFTIRWMAVAATSAGPTTPRIGRLARSSARQASSASPRIRAESGVSTKPAAITFVRNRREFNGDIGGYDGIAAAAIAAMLKPTPGDARACR